MSTELAGVHPTRLELLRLKRRKALAEGIIDILNKDLEALITTLFEFLKEIYLLRKQSWEALNKAYDTFVEAEMITGSRKIEETSLAAQPVNFDLLVGARSGVLGISLPAFQLRKIIPGFPVPRFSLLDTSAIIDDAITRIWDAISHIVMVAEKEASIKAILEVIAVKRLQVNRLQYKVLPQLENAIRYIGLILEETERQDAIRVRVLQRKRKERAMRSR